jgi:subtilase family protein
MQMAPRENSRGDGLRPLIAVLAAACALAPTAASAAIVRPGEGELSPRLAELAKPAVRTAPRAEQTRRLDVARSGPGSLLRRGNRVLVDVRFEHGATSGADELRATGARIVHVSRRYQTVTVAARPFALPRLDDPADVRAVTEVLTPIVHASGPGPVTSVYTPCFGLETSEGDEQLRANEARAKYEVEGTGVKVGVLSDSFDQDPFTPTGAAEDVASGDLPGPGNPCGHTTPVEVLDDSEIFGADEGRAMAQIVHDLAPGAALSFATAFSGELEFADNVRALAKAGANVLVDDVSYFEEPFFQEGPVGVAVSDVTNEDDAAYYSAAGNDNLFDGGGKEIGSWEAPEYRDSGACPATIVAFSEFLEEEGEVGLNPTHCMDFDPGLGLADQTFGITVEAGELLILDLQWAEPWEGVASDLDAFLLNASNELVAGSAEFNEVSERPLEIFVWENESNAPAQVRLVVNRFEGSGTTPRLKFVLLQNGGGIEDTEYSEPSTDIFGPTIFGHNGGKDAMSVGAIRYNTTEEPEGFSSRGPVTHYFGPVDGTTPAEELLSPDELAKPDLVATNGGANTFFGVCVPSPTAWRFFGTSAAAPHASAVAAVAREAEPAANAAEVNEAQRKAAVPVGAFPATAVGSGLVDAVGTLEELGVIPPAGKTLAEPAPAGPCLPPREPVPPSPPPPVPPGPITSTADTKAPQTSFRKHPPKVIRTEGQRARGVFRFGSDEQGVTFSCKIDTSPFRICGARLVRRFSVGSHVVRVKARDAAGNVDQSPAVFRFKVKQVG